MKNLLAVCRDQWDRTAGVVLVISGLIALIMGWVGASGSVLAFEQIPFLISGGLVGVVLVSLGATMWLSADMRDEWRKLDRLEDAVRGARAAEAGLVAERTADAVPAPSRLRLSEC